jgi:hypothetical protein
MKRRAAARNGMNGAMQAARAGSDFDEALSNTTNSKFTIRN